MIAFSIAVVMVENTPNKYHFWTLHEFMGLLATCIVFFQTITGLCRPFLATSEEITPMRLWFKYFHSMSGTVAWFIANMNMLLGMQKLKNSTPAMICHGVWFVFWVLVFLRSTIIKSRSSLGLIWHGYIPERLLDDR